MFYSFSLRLALAYLATEDIAVSGSNIDPSFLALNEVTYPPLGANFGGYRNLDTGGYQILLQYRGADDAFLTISLDELLKGQFTDDLIRDRIVIIGTTAPSSKDLFYTPYSTAQTTDFRMPGVLLHAHATSQILAATLDGQRLPWAVSEGVEVGWIVLAATAGAGLGGVIKRPWVLLGYLLGGTVVIIIVPVTVFALGGWLPLVPALVAWWSTAITIALSRSSLAASSSDSTFAIS